MCVSQQGRHRESRGCAQSNEAFSSLPECARGAQERLISTPVPPGPHAAADGMSQSNGPGESERAPSTARSIALSAAETLIPNDDQVHF